MVDMVDLVQGSMQEMSRVAFVLDIRGGIFFEDIKSSVNALKTRGVQIRTVFLEASDDVILNRYKETRRSHPLSDQMSLGDAIAKERNMMKEQRELADLIIDTSSMNHNELKTEIYRFIEGSFSHDDISVTINSFGFKKGIMRESDYVFDVRFLPNPYYIEKLRHMSGNDQEVRDYVMKYPEAQEFFSKVKDMMTFVIEQNVKDARSSLSISFGCTGGQHRSVTFANLLYDALKGEGFDVKVRHRDRK